MLMVTNCIVVIINSLLYYCPSRRRHTDVQVNEPLVLTEWSLKEKTSVIHKSGRGRFQELLIQTGFRNTGRLLEWSQGELRLY